MLDKLDWAEFVLLICTETYYRRFRGHEAPARGRGVDWEGQLITLEIYNAKSRSTKFVPVIFGSEDRRFIPEPLSDHAQKNPETYRPDVAATLNNLVILNRDQGRMEEARQELAEALQTYRELAQKNPETYRPDVAQTLNNLGILDWQQ